MTENRHFTRIQFDATATLSTDVGSWDTRVIDISLRGALVDYLENAIPGVGDKAVLKLTLSDDITQIEVQGEIIHVHKEHIGMLCEHMDIDSASHLRRIVELNTGSSELLERELDALSRY